MRNQPSQGLVITRTISRVIVVEKPTQPASKTGCWQTGCGCLILLALLFFVLVAIDTCTDGQLLAVPVTTSIGSEITANDG